MPSQLHIDIVSDVVCPWCAIGYAQLERAAAIIADRAEVSVRWHPFELAPDTPKEGKPLADYSRERYGATPEQALASRSRIIETGAALGLDFRYSPESRIYNSFDAHRLLAWAGEYGGQTSLKQALFAAYFTAQANIADADILLDAVDTAGLDREAANAVLTSDAYADQVRTEEAHWVDQNVTGVPAFIVNGKYMIPGAQDAETMLRVFERVIEREALNAVTATS
jgi:predicted DsbA family dithiol-disulfide isomerase